MSKPFNLEAALAGEPVETRDGRKVTEIHHFKTHRGGGPVLAVVDGVFQSYRVDGQWGTFPGYNDLVMASKKHQVWHCVFKNGRSVHVSKANYSCESDLVANMQIYYPDAVIIKTYCTEWEE